MPTDIQTVTAGNQFVGGVGTGEVIFPTIPVNPDRLRTVIDSVSLFGTAVITTVDLRLVGTQDATTVQSVLSDTTGNLVTFYLPCAIVIPLNADGTPFVLQLITTGKTVTATMIVDFHAIRSMDNR